MPKKKFPLTASMIYYYVTDMEEAIKFYSEVLGLKLKIRFENHWAEFEAGPINIGLHPVSAGKKIKSGGGTLSCNVTDIEGFIKDIKSRGAIVGKLQSPERGKFVLVSDPDGNEIHIVEFDQKWIKEKKYRS